MTPSTSIWEVIVAGTLAEVIGSVIVLGLCAAASFVRRRIHQAGKGNGEQAQS
ncbi:hypothetical protein ABT025_38055 [Streptomyces sp. NPDC002809]|uniref:hypothetical protein n=1 Tax=Streptomyces sp. NPDC002809 TaxID=3154433 RepID=UPI00332A7524